MANSVQSWCKEITSLEIVRVAFKALMGAWSYYSFSIFCNSFEQIVNMILYICFVLDHFQSMTAFTFHSLPTCKIYISMIARLATSHLWENRDLPLVLVEITAAHEGSLTMRRATVKMVRDFICQGCPTVLHTDQDYSQISFGWGYKCFVCVLIRIWTESDYSHLSETKPCRIQVRSGLKIGGGAAEPVIPQCFSILYKPNHTIRH